ncbi:MAG TPA: tryptophan--tRNA ligase [Armatimonadetes bacterium]|nr:tryptophan--tRNA ligase [Armatimonadota bacterium]
MRALSGVQPSGKIHIGNYFGAIRQYVRMQDEHEGFFFIANYHALTTIRDPEDMRRQTLDLAADYLALGLDPQKATVFVQSDIPEVCELSWILSTVTPMGLLERCHAYKDKVAQGIPADHGLFAYPVLMAADILIYDSHLVPVGQDQKQHVEVTRDIGERFNNTYGETLVIPEPYILESTAVVPGIDGRKMSKSYDNTIPIFDPEKATRKRIMSIVTDSTPVEGAKDPEKCSVFQLYSLFASEQQRAEMAERYRAGGMGYGDAKKELFEAFMAQFGEARKRREELAANLDYVRDVLHKGAEHARAVARTTLDRCRAACGVDI